MIEPVENAVARRRVSLARLAVLSLWDGAVNDGAELGWSVIRFALEQGGLHVLRALQGCLVVLRLGVPALKAPDLEPIDRLSAWGVPTAAHQTSVRRLASSSARDRLAPMLRVD